MGNNNSCLLHAPSVKAADDGTRGAIDCYGWHLVFTVTSARLWTAIPVLMGCSVILVVRQLGPKDECTKRLCLTRLCKTIEIQERKIKNKTKHVFHFLSDEKNAKGTVVKAAYGVVDPTAVFRQCTVSPELDSQTTVMSFFLDLFFLLTILEVSLEFLLVTYLCFMCVREFFMCCELDIHICTMSVEYTCT